MKEWLIPTLGAVICWAGWAFLPKIAVQHLELKSVLICQVLGGLTIALFILVSSNYQLELNLRASSIAFASGALNILGVLFYLQAITKGKIALVATISALYPLLVIILALLFLQESLSLKQYIGLTFGLFSIILLAA
ncbi:MAG: EamA family transporter [Symploca sp. SIO2E6]|nr:EamA family transporter [Symploca sp. SIO2E6]